MINKESMFEPMLEVAPGFRDDWNEFVSEWEDEGPDLPYYLVMPALARYIASLINVGAEQELNEIFCVIERWHVDGDAYVSEAATIGILEDLQNLNIVKKPDVPDQVEKYLKSESKKCGMSFTNFGVKSQRQRRNDVAYNKPV